MARLDLDGLCRSLTTSLQKPHFLAQSRRIDAHTYQNAENGFCVLRAKARGHRDLVTLVGHAATIAAGEWITASGEWINDRTHGSAVQSAAGTECQQRTVRIIPVRRNESDRLKVGLSLLAVACGHG